MDYLSHLSLSSCLHSYRVFPSFEGLPVPLLLFGKLSLTIRTILSGAILDMWCFHSCLRFPHPLPYLLNVTLLSDIWLPTLLILFLISPKVFISVVSRVCSVPEASAFVSAVHVRTGRTIDLQIITLRSILKCLFCHIHRSGWSTV
jgi:hypothetical protein